MMMSLSMEYLALVFLAVLGVLQLAAMRGRWFKLLFFQEKAATYLLSAVLVLLPLVLLFTWNYRNATGVVQGAEQAGLFMLALVLAVVYTAALSSLMNYSDRNSTSEHKEGLEVLRDMTFYEALCRLLGRKG
jgi:hypothetical protein